MLPFKKIICPTDFNEISLEAVRTAGEIAHYFGSEVYLLNVVSSVPLVPMGPEPVAFNVLKYEQEMEASSKKTLQEIIGQLAWKDLKMHGVVLRGNPADEIVRFALEEKADLIVIATRGRTGFNRFLLGSVAEKVVRLVDCPVLTVTQQPSEEKEGEKPRQEEKADGSESQNEAAKTAFQEKVGRQLKEWGDKIDDLRAGFEKSSEERKTKFEKQMEELRNKSQTVQQKLTEMKESGEKTWEGLKPGIEQGLDELKAAIEQVISKNKNKGSAMADTLARKKKVYLERAEAEVKEWSAQIEVLKAKAEKTKGKIQLKYLDQIEELKNKQEVLKVKLRELRESGSEAWEEFRGGLDDALDDLKEAFKRGVSKLKKP